MKSVFEAFAKDALDNGDSLTDAVWIIQRAESDQIIEELVGMELTTEEAKEVLSLVDRDSTGERIKVYMWTQSKVYRTFSYYGDVCVEWLPRNPSLHTQHRIAG